MFASLPMYDRPELQKAHEEYWQNIRFALSEHGVQSPQALNQQALGTKVWHANDMVLSQTCGMPFRKFLHERVNLVGTPDFAVDGCPAGYYCSHFVVRQDDQRNALSEFQSAIFAFNEINSQSGYAAAWNHLKPKNLWFKHFLKTDAHLKSAQAVITGHADIAAIDAVTWRLAKRYERFTDQLRVIETTIPTPGLPYITSIKHDPDIIFDAVSRAITFTDQKILSLLGIRQLVRIPKSDYLSIPNPDL